MESRIPVAFLIVFLIVVIGAFLVWGPVLSGRFTGLTVFAQGASNLTFIAPTPANGSVTNAPFVIINVSADENISFAAVAWGSQNISMERQGTMAWAVVNGSGAFSVVVYAINALGHASNTEERIISLGYINWSVVPDQIISEDTNFSLDLRPMVRSVKPLAELGFAVSSDRSDRVSCSLNASRWLVCLPVHDAVGATRVVVTADDSVVSATLAFNLTLSPVNDPPRLIGQLEGKTITSNGVWEVDAASLFMDPDGDPLSFSVAQGVNVSTVWVSSSLVRFSSNASTSGSYSIILLANDSHNVTASNNVTLVVQPNRPPQVITKLTSLVLNDSKAYKLRYYQIFKDPDDDPLTFSYENVSVARIVTEKNALYLVTKPNVTGTAVLKLSASDGQYTSSYELPVVVGGSGSETVVNGSSSEASAQVTVSPSTNQSQAGPESSMRSSNGIPDMQVQPGEIAIINLSKHMDLSGLDSETAQVQVVGIKNFLIDQIDGFFVSLTPRPGWVGSEKMHVVVFDRSSKVDSNEFRLSVAVNGSVPAPSSVSGPGSFPLLFSSGPVLKRALPTVWFNSTGQEATIDLSEYFEDLSGRGLEFIIEKKKDLKTSIHGKSVAIISLSSPDTRVGNQTIRVIAKDADGNILTGDVVVSVLDSVYRYQGRIDTFLQVVMGLLLMMLLGVAYFRYSGDERFVQYRLPHFSFGWHSAQEQHHAPASQPGAVSGKAPVAWRDRQSVAGLIVDAMDHWMFGGPVKKGLDEPPEFKREALLIKESLLGLKAIASSCDDRLIRAALNKEQEKLRKALELLRSKASLSRTEVKRLCLYVKEAASATEQILDLTEEYLIYHELKRVSVRLRRLSKDLELRLSYFGELPHFSS